MCVEDIRVTYRCKKQVSWSSSEERKKDEAARETTIKRHEGKKVVNERRDEREIEEYGWGKRRVTACLI